MKQENDDSTIDDFKDLFLRELAVQKGKLRATGRYISSWFQSLHSDEDKKQ